VNLRLLRQRPAAGAHAGATALLGTDIAASFVALADAGASAIAGAAQTAEQPPHLSHSQRG
jgi:hypothetical protein